ncbi:aldehyde dehydrogenase family protein [Brucella sp. NBRC 12950]|uniref:aldehyde dehydrogenase family protein n=1 Tax=Brucella sp. NBRC 12950 TaxID=2994518 RepID=UPI0024A4E670|nr:aldehyde dehydrogenase family protein [Brucella sp. NBRC 12950]GLU29838.1 aldehyde dehydrogenase [Brucella sp. NBRC 12950]
MDMDPKSLLPQTARNFLQFIDGNWTKGRPDGELVRKSPAHGTNVTVIQSGSRFDTDCGVAAARSAFDDGRWSSLPSSIRAEKLREVAGLIRKNAEELAILETLEAGKPISQSRGEIAAAAGIWDYAAGLAQVLHGDSFNNLGSDLFGMVLREPIGVVGVITPWNYPFFILSERLPFILASGCTAVVKPSEMTSATTLRLAELIVEAGIPDGVVNVVTGPGSVVGQALVDHQDVDMISFTGSTHVGRSAIVASAQNIKKVSLELGGKNPQIVFADADLEAAADGLVHGMVYNAGQTCVSGSRFICEKGIGDVLKEKVLRKLARVKTGDPLDPEVQVGAIISAKQRDQIMSHISDAQAEGACLDTGGKSLDGPGFFIEPTLFSNIRSDMAINRAEVFGPVASIMEFESADEAVRIANDSEYGLSAGVWVGNLTTAFETIRKIKAGRVWVNTFLTGGPEMPIGGYKQSGTGRETGKYGVEEYTEVKSVHIDMGARKPWVK